MKVSEARFTRRYNVGQYEHEEYTLVAVVEDNDKASDVLDHLKLEVHQAHSRQPVGTSVDISTTSTRRLVSSKKSSKRGSSSSDEF